MPRIEHGLCSVSSGLVSNGTKCEAGWLPEVEAGSEVETAGRAVCAGRCAVARASGVWGGWQRVGKRAVTKGAGAFPTELLPAVAYLTLRNCSPSPRCRGVGGAYHVPSSGSNGGPFLWPLRLPGCQAPPTAKFLR